MSSELLVKKINLALSATFAYQKKPENYWCFEHKSFVDNWLGNNYWRCSNCKYLLEEQLYKLEKAAI